MKTYTVESLTSRAMAVLGCKRLVSTQFVCDFAAVAVALPFHVEVLVFVMDAVWLSVLPLVFLAVCGVSSLILVSVAAN